MKKLLLGKYIVGFQAWYYIVTGLWAIISIESFNRIVGHTDNDSYFEMHSIAAMALVLGIYYFYSIKKPTWFKENKSVIYLVIGINLSIIAVELAYLSEIKETLFFADLIEEIIITLFLFWVIKK